MCVGKHVPCSDNALQIDTKGCQAGQSKRPSLQRISIAALRQVTQPQSPSAAVSELRLGSTPTGVSDYPIARFGLHAKTLRQATGYCGPPEGQGKISRSSPAQAVRSSRDRRIPRDRSPGEGVVSHE